MFKNKLGINGSKYPVDYWIGLKKLKKDEVFKGEIKKMITDNKEYIGKIIKIKIDRQLGSKHPKHGFIYPVNYGYLEGVISGDGEELDCYLLGVFNPLDEYEGKCIAVLHRLDDNDDKLIVVPFDKEYDDRQIDALVEFQEQYFKYIIIR